MDSQCDDEYRCSACGDCVKEKNVIDPSEVEVEIELENKLALISRRELEFSHNRHQEDIKNTKILNETEVFLYF